MILWDLRMRVQSSIKVLTVVCNLQRLHMTMWMFTHKHNCNPKFAQWSTDLHVIQIIFCLLLHKSFRRVFEKFRLAYVKKVYVFYFWLVCTTMRELIGNASRWRDNLIKLDNFLYNIKLKYIIKYMVFKRQVSHLVWVS